MTEEQRRDIERLFSDLDDQISGAEEDSRELAEFVMEIEGVKGITLAKGPRSAAECMSRYFDEIGGAIDELKAIIRELE